MIGYDILYVPIWCTPIAASIAVLGVTVVVSIIIILITMINELLLLMNYSIAKTWPLTMYNAHITSSVRAAWSYYLALGTSNPQMCF